MNCEVSGLPYGERHHIVSRGRARSAAEIPENIIYLHPDYHRLGPDAVHNIGWRSFAERFGLTERFEKAREAVFLALRAENTP
jgi:hypothetical protein